MGSRSPKPFPRRHTRFHLPLRALLVWGTLLALPNLAAFAADPKTAAPLPAEEVVARLVEANHRRDAQMGGYNVTRRYVLKGELYKEPTTMDVDVAFRSPGELTFEVRAQQGSNYVTKRVFGRMMQGEQEAIRPEEKRRSAMTPENYAFKLVGQEVISGRPAYKLEVDPKREDTFLIRGHIWVDAEDFAVVRAEGSPVKRPSFWTRKITFIRSFRKVGPFWLPERTESVNEVLLFGTFWVSIENRDYRVRLQPAARP